MPTGVSSMVLPEPGRKKAWATRARTGCYTCRARRVKCDEKQPVCKRCLVGHRACLYPTWRREEPGEPMSQEGVVGLAALHQTEPPEWNVAEAMTFCNSFLFGLCNASRKLINGPIVAEVLVPMVDKVGVTMGEYKQLWPAAPHISLFPFHPSFLLMVTSRRIQIIAAQRGVSLHRGQGHGIEHLWRRWFGYMTLTLAHLNQLLATRAAPRYVVMRTVDLLTNELFIVDSLWRCHLNGFFAIVALYGGVDSILATSSRPPYLALHWGLIHTIVGNACSPVQDQIDGIYSWSEQQICTIYTFTFVPSFASPSVLFLALHRINRLRVLVARASQSAATLRITAEETAQSVHRFAPIAWAETYPLPIEPLKTLLATLFKDTVILYAILSLPLDLAQPFASVYWDEIAIDPAKTARRYYRERILATINQTTAYIPVSYLGWILAVLGAASLDGPEETKTYVLAQLQAILRMESNSGGVAVLLELLPKYWLQTRQGWERCYYKSGVTV
ncbi:hypothetical protein NLG97_g4670 [Lecanicillium saksenae]|uniref:Uncharacterized protein n=1 Tax=Lecanicillium saksenae TaxID=468837 RepID=A0ACC1QVV1_9HYPO|nr:hypothetical protein NLG97_g4670 [Lecanicillium saksenae]